MTNIESAAPVDQMFGSANSGVIVHPADPTTLNDLESRIAPLTEAEPEFRVVTAKGERKGVRLEPVFWRALDLVAAEMAVPRNTLALSVMALAEKRHTNATSLLRSFLIAYLIQTRSHATD